MNSASALSIKRHLLQMIVLSALAVLAVGTCAALAVPMLWAWVAAICSVAAALQAWIAIRLYHSIRRDISQLTMVVGRLGEGIVERPFHYRTAELNTLASAIQTVGNGLIDRQRTLSNIGLTDHLSRLDNRRSLDHKLREYWGLAQRGYPITVLLIDIDRFKDINDHYGHDAGDILIRRFADFLLRGVRNSDFVARLGGDEFCVVFPYESLDTAIDLTRRLRRTIPQYTTITNGLKCPLGWSGGLAEIHPDDEDYRQVLGRADRAMLQAKAAGRNRTSVYTESSPLKLTA